MENFTKAISCDGCGMPATPEHIAERVLRLELATRYRPVHMQVLFVGQSPPSGAEHDFYGATPSAEFFEAFMDALGISLSTRKASAEALPEGNFDPRLMEFQRRGYYLSYLSECPLPLDGTVPVAGEISESRSAALGQTLLRRIRLNYKPKKIVLIGEATSPLIPLLVSTGYGTDMILEGGEPLPVPTASTRAVFKRALGGAIAAEQRVSEYDSIQSKQT